MKILKIEEGKGAYSINGRDWLQIDAITKDDLLALLRFTLNNDVEFDEYIEAKLPNQAQQIIYKSIHDKFKALIPDKKRFKDESDRMYLAEIEYYKKT